MLNDILEIPGNRPVFDDLQRLLAEKKAIAFVGAGASAGLYPLWGQLIRQLCDEAVGSGFASDADRQFWLSMADTKPGQVVRGIRQKLTSPQLGSLLRNIFGPKPSGPRHTAIHAALMRVPFSGYVTTNYDPGLIEARRVERPAVTAVGWSTWRDGDEFDGWRDPARLVDPSWCPVLFAHGFYQRSDTIVLGIEEYRRAYDPGPWRRLFEHLWSSTHLLFVGFGFSDPFLDFITGEIVTQTAEQTAAAGRHIAFIGLGADEPYSEERRRFFLQNYNVRPLFYPVVGSDHSELLTLLDRLTPKAPSPPLPVPTPPLPSLEAFPSRWVHETTNDEKFTGREDELARLDRWVADPAIRVIGISAMGGTGKTALVGHWLQNTSRWQSRPFVGLFAWSFYEDRDGLAFLRSLLEWAQESFGMPKPTAETGLLPASLRLLQTHTLVVVLDGLEVLQEGPENARHGAFLDGSLREFLRYVCVRQNRGSLAILTSRFIFVDLERHLGTTFHQLELPGLAPEEGSMLIAEFGVRGLESDRMDISLRLEGHPLGLRVFAEAIPEASLDHPREFLDQAVRSGQLFPDASITGKVRRLLVFYKKRLPLIQIRLLSVIALFRSPVAEDTILHLARSLFPEDSESLHSKPALARELWNLHARGVLTRATVDDENGYACHPIFRDYFRAALLGEGVATAQRAANLLQGQPSEERPRTVREIEPVLIAVELLLDAGEFQAADELFCGRLEDGTLFLRLPALPEGLSCALAFVRDEPRRKQCQKQLTRARLAFYLSAAGLFAGLSGHYELAFHFNSEGNAIDFDIDDAPNLCVGLQNEAEFSVALGRLAEAEERSTRALGLARTHANEKGIRNIYTRRGWVRGLLGQVQEAAEDFAIANALEKKRTGHAELFSLRGIWWTELLVRTGHLTLAISRTKANLQICERHSQNSDIARCHWMLGACALAGGRLEEAEIHICKAEPVFYKGQMLLELSALHVTAGVIALSRRDVGMALHRADEALALAQPREMRLVYTDALVLRGRARLLDAAASHPDNVARALDDAAYALRLARYCGYSWGDRDALTLQADANGVMAKTYEAIGKTSTAARHRDAAHRVRSEADALSARLRLTDADLRRAETKAEAWLREWERIN